MTITIFGAPQSNFVWASRIGAHLTAQEVRLRPARPHSDQIKAINPTGKMPALDHDGFHLGETSAILIYLDRLAGGDVLFPSEAQAAAKVMMWLSILTTQADPALLRAYLVPRLFAGKSQADLQAALDATPAIFALLADGLGGRDWFGGDRFAAADCLAVPTLTMCALLPELKERRDAHPVLTDYVTRGCAHLAVKATTPPPIPGI